MATPKAKSTETSERVAQEGQSPLLARQQGKCAACGRIASEISECGSFITCAREAVPLVADDVIAQCKSCGATRVVSVGLAMKGKPAIGRGAEGAVCRCGESQNVVVIG